MGVRKEVCLAYVPDVAGRRLHDRARRFRVDKLDEASALETLESCSEMSDCSTRNRHQGGPAKYLDEFGDAELAKRLLDDIAESTTQNWALMEVCGGQTHTIIRNGIDQLLPDQIELIHGPGCRSV